MSKGHANRARASQPRDAATGGLSSASNQDLMEVMKLANDLLNRRGVDSGWRRIEPYAAMMQELSNAENNVIYATISFDLVVLLAGRGEALIVGLVKYGRALKETYDAMLDTFKRYGQDPNALVPNRVKQVNERLDSLGRAFDDYGCLTEQGYAELINIAKAQGDRYRTEIFEARLRDFAAEQERLEAERRAAEEQARLSTIIEKLTPTERTAGELRWAIKRIKTETSKTQKPAAEILRDRLKTGEQAETLSERERELYLTLQTWLDGDRARQAIGDLFTEYKDVPDIPWEHPTIRL